MNTDPVLWHAAMYVAGFFIGYFGYELYSWLKDKYDMRKIIRDLEKEKTEPYRFRLK